MVASQNNTKKQKLKRPKLESKVKIFSNPISLIGHIYILEMLPSPIKKQKELRKPLEDELIIGHGASICLARAIARAVYSATPKPNDIKPTFRE